MHISSGISCYWHGIPLVRAAMQVSCQAPIASFEAHGHAIGLIRAGRRLYKAKPGWGHMGSTNCPGRRLPLWDESTGGSKVHKQQATCGCDVELWVNAASDRLGAFVLICYELPGAMGIMMPSSLPAFRCSVARAGLAPSGKGLGVINARAEGTLAAHRRDRNPHLVLLLLSAVR